MVLPLILHFLLGVALGLVFRIGVMLLVAGALVAEVLLGWLSGAGVSEYWAALFCFIAAQAGFVMASALKPTPKPAQSSDPDAPVSRFSRE